MPPDLYHTIPSYFEDRMRGHDKVRSYRRLDSGEEYVYEIVRTGLLGRIKVWLSDAYHFTDIDFHNRPKILGRGDYILIAKPEGGWHVTPSLIVTSCVGIGKLAELMGALNSRNVWTYVPPSEEERHRRRWRLFPRGQS